jgi:hypothetical protein
MCEYQAQAHAASSSSSFSLLVRFIPFQFTNITFSNNSIASPLLLDGTVLILHRHFFFDYSFSQIRVFHPTGLDSEILQHFPPYDRDPFFIIIAVSVPFQLRCADCSSPLLTASNLGSLWTFFSLEFTACSFFVSVVVLGKVPLLFTVCFWLPMLECLGSERVKDDDDHESEFSDELIGDYQFWIGLRVCEDFHRNLARTSSSPCRFDPNCYGVGTP